MTDNTHSAILRRMTRQQPPETGEPLTSSRALRMALVKVANDTIGLTLCVLSMAEEMLSLDDLLAALDDNQMLVALREGEDLRGLVAIDSQLRAAAIEVQTIGQVVAMRAEDRPPTNTDKVMCERVLAAFVEALPNATVGTRLEGWVDDIQLAKRFSDARTAGLELQDIQYRLVRLSIDLGTTDREGEILVALPFVAEDTATELVQPRGELSWGDQWQEMLQAAPAQLDAVLHRFSLPLADAQELRAGQVLSLHGCTVNSVKLMAPDGRTVVQAKLGQAGGMRAVRIEKQPGLELVDLATDAVIGAGAMLPSGSGASHSMANGGASAAVPVDTDVGSLISAGVDSDKPVMAEAAAKVPTGDG